MRKKIVVVVSAPMMIKFFLMHHLKELSILYDVTLVTNFQYGCEYLEGLPSDIQVVDIGIKRDISLYSDFIALVQLLSLFKRHDFSLVHSVSPKAGLLSMVAAKIVGIKIRLHTFTGQRWITKKGFIRWLLKLTDKIIARTTSVILLDSQSQKNFLVENNIIFEKKSIVLGDGSISGVDVDKFKKDMNVKAKFRSKLNIKSDHFVFLFVGRLTKDKGVFDLLNAFLCVLKIVPDSVLVFVGPDEEGVEERMQALIVQNDEAVIFVPYTSSPENYMMMADVLCLPSYREGFGSTVIEAAACGVPAICTNIYGLIDAVVDDVTGILVPVGDINILTRELVRIAQDSKLRNKLAENAYRRAIKDFNQNRVTNELVKLYSNLL